MQLFVDRRELDEISEWNETRYMPPAMVAGWRQGKRSFVEQLGITPQQSTGFRDSRRAVIRAFAKAGIGILAGSDAVNVMSVPGFALHRELQALVAAGLTPHQALETATVNVARFLGELDTRGTVSVGKRSDLLLLDSDPIADIANTRKIAGVLIGPRWYGKEEISERLARLEFPSSLPDR
jgi:imidazolonepropionase-like amidohydrolase